MCMAHSKECGPVVGELWTPLLKICVLIRGILTKFLTDEARLRYCVWCSHNRELYSWVAQLFYNNSW